MPDLRPIACFPWYDLPEIQVATDRLWQATASALHAAGLQKVPASLDRRADYESQWGERELLLGQACGYDVYCANDHELQIVGVPRYDMDGCDGTRYRSFVIVRKDSGYSQLKDLRGARCVINSPRSHSGMNVLQAVIAPLASQGSFFNEVRISGAHERSLQMISAGTADVAAIDCITYGLLARHRPSSLAATRIIHRTMPVTAPPYITSAHTDEKLLPVLRRAIHTAIESLNLNDRADLGIVGIEPGAMADYKELDELQEQAHSVDYRELAEWPTGS